jgi:hypothetical protein
MTRTPSPLDPPPAAEIRSSWWSARPARTAFRSDLFDLVPAAGSVRAPGLSGGLPGVPVPPERSGAWHGVGPEGTAAMGGPSATVRAASAARLGPVQKVLTKGQGRASEKNL